MKVNAQHGHLQKWLSLYITVFILLIIRLQFYIRTEAGNAFFDNGVAVSYILFALCCLSFKGLYTRYAAVHLIAISLYAIVDNTWFSIMKFSNTEETILLALFLVTNFFTFRHWMKKSDNEIKINSRDAITAAFIVFIAITYLAGRNHREYFPDAFKLMGFTNDMYGTAYYQSQALTEVVCSVVLIMNTFRLDLLTAIYHLLLTIHNFLGEVAGNNTRATMADWEVVNLIHGTYAIMLLGYLLYQWWKHYKQRRIA